MPNPSFEMAYNIPCGPITTAPLFDNTMNSWIMPTGGSSDIYSTTMQPVCYSSTNSSHLARTGAQPPRTGQNYTGIFTYGLVNYREYIEVELTENMVPGDQYLARMYVSKADRVEFGANNLGMHFSDSLIQQISSQNLNVIPQVKTLSVMLDSANWVEISDTIIVTSPAKFLTIGNFNNNSTTNVVYQTSTGYYNNESYYYIDDVSLTRLTFNYTPSALTICRGDSVELYATFDGFTHWVNDSTPGVILSTDSVIWVQPDSTLGYSAMGNGNSSYTLVTVLQHPPSVDLGPDTTVCFDDYVQFNINNPDFSINWKGGSSSPTYSTNNSGFTWVDVYNSCFSNRDSVYISHIPELFISIGPDTTICVGDTITLMPDGVFDNYYWTDDDSLATLMVDTTGLYILIVEYECGFANDYKWVYLDSMPSLELSSDTSLCFGNSFTVSDSTNSYLSYTWQDGSSDSTYLVDTSGIYWLDVTHRCGADRDSVTIDYFEIVDINFGNDTSICIGDSIVLTVPSHNGNVTWVDGSNENNLTVENFGQYWVEVAENGCFYSDSLVIDTISIPYLQIQSDSVYCEGDSVLIAADVQGEDQLTWSTGENADSIFVNEDGLYFAAATNICGTSYDNIEIIERPLPLFSLGADTSFCLGDFIFIIADGIAGTIVWEDGSTNYQKQISEDGYYWATAKHQGCSYTDTIYVDTVLCEIVLELPNVLTPNNDGENDVFKAIRLGGIDELNIQIFNRWGQLVFLSNSKYFTWDGRNFADEIVPTGTYFYIIEYTDVLGIKKNLSGNIGLFR